MRTLFIALVMVFAAATSYSQWIWNGFERAAADSFFQHYPLNTGLGTGSGYIRLSDNTTGPAAYHGSAALKCEWQVHSNQTWGGFVQMMRLVPLTDSTYIDFSSGSNISIWYYNVTPSSQVGLVSMRFKLHEAGGNARYWGDQNDHEDWYSEIAGIYDAAPGWKQLLIPLKDLGAGNPTSTGFTLPGWSGRLNNGTLDFDKIIGYSIEWTTPGITNQGSAQGVVVWDKLQTTGFKTTPVTTFDSVAVKNFFGADTMSWAAGNKSSLRFTDVTTDPFEGYSSLKVNWKVHMSESWGGYANFSKELPSGQFFKDMTSNTDLLLFVKNSVKSTIPKRVTLRLFLYDWSSGVKEEWCHLIKVNLDTSISTWQMIKLPLVSVQSEPDANVLSTKGFKIPGWINVKGNSLLDLNKIGGYRLEFSGDASGPQGALAEGEIWFDLLIPTGYRETDVTPPTPPASLAAVAGSFVNLVTWTDVSGETGETYDVYYSDKPITDVKAAGVEVVRLSVPENTQVAEHVLRAPATNQSVSYYYAITCTDKVGNKSLPGKTATATSNTAKGVPTISLSPPASFRADGDLAEWSSITPIRIYLSDGTGSKVTNTKIDNDADLSVKAYLAVDNQFLYVAFDITDNVVQVDTTQSDTWMQDCPDLFIGLFDWRGLPHTSYLRGARPDYHFRFSENRVLEDGHLSTFDLRPGTNYKWFRKFPSGYNIEAKISLSALATAGGDSLFRPKEGMRIPIDFSINDNDDPGVRREGILTYSPRNEDQSWSDVSRWTHTWIGNKWTTTGLEEEQLLPYSYELLQNYPNPFNPTTQINYTLQKDGFVTLRIFDLLGRQVAQVVNEMQQAGKYTVSLNAAGLRMGSGVYFYQIESGSFREVRKMLLIK